MKKYYIDVYFSGTKRVEVFADNGEEAVRLAEKEVLKEDSDKMLFLSSVIHGRTARRV